METWFIYPVIAAFLFATVNYLDKYIIEKVSAGRGIGALVIFSALAGVPVVLILSGVMPNEVFNISFLNAILMILAGMFYLVGVIFYLFSIWQEDVSSVIPQMLLIPVISILLGYFFLGETISSSQLIGGALILCGAFVLTSSFKSLKHARLKVFLFIFGASFFISLNQIVFKYGIIEDVTFWSALYWEHIGFIITAILIYIFVPKFKKDFIKLLKRNGWFAFTTNSASEALNIFGNIAMHYGTVLAPVGLVTLTVEGTQPFFLLGIGIILTKLWPHIIKEDIQRAKLLIKTIALSLMLGGVVLI